MTPLQFAKEQCANFENGGGCAGIGIKDDGRLYMFGKKAECVLSKRAPCQYFEECVLPMGFELSNARNVQRAKDHEEAKDLYARFAPSYSKRGNRKCQQCQQRPVAPRHRFCSICAKDRETKRAKLAMQSKRQSNVTNLDQNTP